MFIRRATLALVLCLATLLSAGTIILGVLRPAKEKPKMGLEVTLSLERTELIVGESASFALTFTNTTDAPLTIPDPQRRDDWPKLRVRDLQRRTEKIYGPHDLEKMRSDEFTAPRPAATLTLTPRQQFRMEADLLRWVELLAPGNYELTALMAWPGGESASDPVALNVQPLKLRSAYFVGSDSGHTPFRYCVWSQAKGPDSIILLSLVRFDHHGHPELTLSRRLVEVEGDARPVASVSPRNLPYPAHWIVWVRGDQLFGFYELNGQVKTPVNTGTHNLNVAWPVGPVMLDLKGSDGSRPARGHVALWQTSRNAVSLSMRTFEPDGSLSAGPQFAVNAGELRSGRGAMLANGEHRYVLAVQRGDEATLELVRRSASPPAAASAAVAFARLQGQLIAGGMTLNQEDTIFGAALLRDQPAAGRRAAYALQHWHVDAAASAPRAEQPAPMRCDENLKAVRAVVEVSPQGRALALLQAADRKWHWGVSGGACLALSEQLTARFGEPVGAFWLNEVTPFVVMAGAQTGITYQPLPANARRADE